MNFLITIIKLLLVAAFVNSPAQINTADADKLLLHWNFDKGERPTVKDLSGNGLDGNVSAAWVESPRGKAVMMDGTPRTIVDVQIPK